MSIAHENQLIVNPYKTKTVKASQKSQRSSETYKKPSYIGLTLQQYFKGYNNTLLYGSMQSIKEQQNVENKQSQTETPQFGLNNMRQKNRQILKTQLNQQNTSFQKHHNMMKHQQNRCFNKINISLADANHVIQNNIKKQKKYNNRTKRLVTHPSKISDAFNQTSIGTFYYNNQKKDKMLQKIKVEKQRIKSLKLNQMMLITKYASKFNINIKQMIK